VYYIVLLYQVTYYYYYYYYVLPFKFIVHDCTFTIDFLRDFEFVKKMITK